MAKKRDEVPSRRLRYNAEREATDKLARTAKALDEKTSKKLTRDDKFPDRVHKYRDN